ncbi:unnamed protein product [Bemisia tabaci]|uniref:Uncharacterized protein n=1 Tax=Bemisia tabaci TaxID=7038 RepID=A0A9P0AM63_BEMTA|nr:unnamed protein product [Bemisia tabaci]
MNTSRITPNTVRSAAAGVKLTAPKRLSEYFTHCAKRDAVSAARRRKLKTLIHIYVCSFIIFSFIYYEWKALSTQR